MSLPRNVKVGPLTYRIQVSPGLEDLGRCENDDCLILLRAGLDNSVLRETLWHEVLHACSHTFHVQWKGEEGAVRRFSPVLLDVLRRNPRLVEYLTGG